MASLDYYLAKMHLSSNVTLTFPDEVPIQFAVIMSALRVLQGPFPTYSQSTCIVSEDNVMEWISLPINILISTIFVYLLL